MMIAKDRKTTLQAIHTAAIHHTMLSISSIAQLIQRQSTYDMITDDNKTHGLSPTTRKPTGHNSRKTQVPFSLRPKTNIILMADNHNIPKGKMYSNRRLLPNHIVYKITQRNNIRRANTYALPFKLLNEKITSDIQKHKQNIWKEHIDTH